MKLQRIWFPSLVVGSVVFVACTPEPPAAQPPTVSIPPKPADTTNTDGSIPPRHDKITVAAVKRPEASAIDGDLTEWGKRTEGATIALDAQGWIVAADGVADGFWLGIASTVPELPGIGTGWSNGLPVDMDCDKNGKLVDGKRWTEQGGPATEASRKECSALLDGYAQLVRDHERRFVRRFRIDATGVQELAEGGALTPVTGARAAWKKDAVEVSLPLTALPRMSEAPLTWIGAWAHGGDALPEIDLDKAKVTLAAPVNFEPYSKLRARALLNNNDFQQKGGAQYRTATQSYQPGVPERLEYIDYDGPSKLVRHDGALYEKKATLGDIEVGALHGFVESMAIFRRGELIDVVPSRPASEAWGGEGACSGERSQWGAVILRDGAIHLLASYEGQENSLACGIVGSSLGGWGVLVIGADGGFHEATYEKDKALLCEDKLCSCSPGQASADDALTKLVWKGKCLLPMNGSDMGELERTLTWDDKKRRYVLTATKRPAKSK